MLLPQSLTGAFRPNIFLNFLNISFLYSFIPDLIKPYIFVGVKITIRTGGIP